MPMNVFVRDIDGRFTHINPAYENFYRLKKKDIVGKTLAEVLPVHEEEFGAHDDHVIKTGELQTVEEKPLREMR
jgi:PAS domain S-box-containing protein